MGRLKKSNKFNKRIKMEGFFGIVLLGLLLWIGYKYMILNAKIPKNKIIDYLDKNHLIYVGHKKVKKPWNPNFESGESIFTVFAYRKRYYEIEALKENGDSITFIVRWYQSMSFFHGNKAVFELKD